MLSENTISVIKSTVPVLEVHGLAITNTFYKNLFDNNPSLLNIFNHKNQASGLQQGALANTILAAAKHIDKLGDILPVVVSIGHKHRALGVKSEHYGIVGETLLGAIKEVLGDSATNEILNAWGEAYGVISKIFIDIENKLYKEAEEQVGGWKDFKPFKVSKKVKESDMITSFYFENPNGNVPIFNPGQYITVKIEENGRAHNRHYSLSDIPSKLSNNTYRISVKRESSDNLNGIVSNILHSRVNEGDFVNLSAPAGNFTLDIKNESPLILISAGVGITPIFSMLNFALEHQSQRSISFIHSSKDCQHQAFLNELTNLSNKFSNNLKVFINHSNPTTTDNTIIKVGKLDKSLLESYIFNNTTTNEAVKINILTHAEIYICGPFPFMKDVNSILLGLGFQKEKIHYEVFGPLSSI